MHIKPKNAETVLHLIDKITNLIDHMGKKESFALKPYGHDTVGTAVDVPDDELPALAKAMATPVASMWGAITPLLDKAVSDIAAAYPAAYPNEEHRANLRAALLSALCSGLIVNLLDPTTKDGQITPASHYTHIQYVIKHITAVHNASGAALCASIPNTDALFAWIETITRNDPAADVKPTATTPTPLESDLSRMISGKTIH